MLRDIPSVVGCLFDAVHVSILAIDHKVVIANMVLFTYFSHVRKITHHIICLYETRYNTYCAVHTLFHNMYALLRHGNTNNLDIHLRLLLVRFHILDLVYNV